MNNVQRVKVSGLCALLVECRLGLIEDIIATSGIAVTLEWIPSAENKADQLSQVPQPFLDCYKKLKSSVEIPVVTAVISMPIVGPVTLVEIQDAQLTCPVVQDLAETLESDHPVSIAKFKNVQSQLVMGDGMVMHCVKLPVDGEVSVYVVTSSLQDRVVTIAHKNSGHGSRETSHQMLRGRCYFPGIASACRDFFKSCSQCSASSPSKGPGVQGMHPDIPGRLWVEVIDVLELGADRSTQCHCVLVCVDAFTKSRWLC